MKILLLGANGQIGREIQELAKNKVELYAYTRQELDITQLSCIESSFAAIRPHYIINTAAYTSVAKAEVEEKAAYLVNAVGVSYLAEAAKRFNIPLMHISTDYVFDGRKKTPYVEEDLPNPLSVYGRSKWAGENFIRDIWYKHIILRVSWVFGCHGNNFVKNILHLATVKSELKIVCDQVGSPSYAGDIANTLLNIIDAIQQGFTNWGTYHFTGTPVTNWYQFARLIIKHASTSQNLLISDIRPIYSNEYPTSVFRPSNSQLECRKINSVFNITQKNWLFGLTKVIKWYALFS